MTTPSPGKSAGTSLARSQFAEPTRTINEEEE